MMNRNAIRASYKKLSESTIHSLEIFVLCMTIITISLLILTATTEPGVVYNQRVLKELMKEHVKQRRACCGRNSSSSHHRDEDLGDTNNTSGNNQRVSKKKRRQGNSDEESCISLDGSDSNSDNDMDETESSPLTPKFGEYSDSEGYSSSESVEGDEVLDEEKYLRSDQDQLQVWRLKNLPYCSICKVQTPERMDIYHCHECGFCIEKMDHHCPWMGQCVGKRNMKWFILFNLSWILFLGEFLYLVFSAV